jgi:hypothetical protein
MSPRTAGAVGYFEPETMRDKTHDWRYIDRQSRSLGLHSYFEHSQKLVSELDSIKGTGWPVNLSLLSLTIRFLRVCLS